MCRYEERLAVSVTNLAKTSLDADRGLKVREQFLVEKKQQPHLQQENETSQSCAKQSEENDSLEQQLKDAQYTRTESENKYEALARKLQTQESEGMKSEERAENVEVSLVVDGDSFHFYVPPFR